MLLTTRVAAIGLLLATASGACTVQASGDLGQLQALAKTCPAPELVEYVGDDVSGSGRQDAIVSARASALNQVATEVAVCGGHLRVDAFTGSAAASSIVFDGDLKPAGATEIARLRKVTALVNTTMTAINAGLATATKSLSPNGSDITSQLGMAAQPGCTAEVGG